MRKSTSILAAAALVAGTVLTGTLSVSPSVAQSEQPPVEIPLPEPVDPVEMPDAEAPVEPALPPQLPVTPPPADPVMPPPEVIDPAPTTSAAPQALGVVLGGIDKVAARTAKFEINLRQQVVYNTLIIKAFACKTRPPEEPPESAAFLEILERKPDGTMQKLFSGWMFASSPALNALEHPVYDVWVVSCKTAPAANTPPVPPNT
jgi:hypothetical protein